ncbi:MAG: phosphotransferase, partial [Promethearchaeota archaeon]
IKSISLEPCGRGEGLLGDIARIVVEYEGNASNLPNSMIAKWHPFIEFFYNWGIQTGIIENEVRFYSEIAPISPIRVPNLIYSDFNLNSKRFALILEDCSKYTAIDLIKGMNYEQTKIAVISLAKFHSRWWNANDLFSFKWIPEYKQSIFRNIYEQFQPLWNLVKQKEEFKSDLPDQGLELVEKYHKKMIPLAFENLPNHSTILHGDFRSSNFFIDNNDTNNPLIVFDWTHMNIGFGTLDLACLLSISVSIEVRRKYEKQMVKLYLRELIENGVEISDLAFKDFWYNYLRDLLKYISAPLFQYLGDVASETRTELRKVITTRIFTAILDNDLQNIFPP